VGFNETPPGPLSIRTFLLLFAFVALSFLGGTAYSHYVQISIQHAAGLIAGNAAPSIEHLSNARTELRHLQALLNQSAHSSTNGPEMRTAATRARERFRAASQAYLALPAFPGERELWPNADRDLKVVDATIERSLASLEQGDFSGATDILSRQMPAAIDRIATGMARAVEFNAAEISRLAAEIGAVQRRTKISAYVVDGLSVLLALSAAFLLFRTVRQYTALVEAHQRLTERRADELSQFAHRVAHDILSPLGSTAMALGIAEKSLPAASRAKEAIRGGNRSLQRVQRLVAALLEFAQAGAQPLPGARAEVGPVLDDVLNDVRPAATAARIEVSVEAFSRCPVACSAGILTSLLSNLLRNAIKYMGDRTERRITVRVRERQDAVRVEIVDTGPGVPEHLRKEIFEPYVRGSTSGQPGIGLGLATVKRITQAHGGDVGVESSIGQGSVFWFELPKPNEAPG
jgi:signal transduction histidine kinase